MAHKTLVNGTAYEIKGGKTLVNGTGYSIKNGKTLVGGTAYTIGFVTQIGELAVGSSVFLNVNGARREFLIVHQGLPSSRYDSSCNGTWLLMKDLYDERPWDSTGTSDYKNSEIHTFLNSTFLGLLDANVQARIIQAKIPYANGNGNDYSVSFGASGLSTKIFLLAGKEVGISSSSGLPDDGDALSFFNGMSSKDSRRVAYYNGNSKPWWLRSLRDGVDGYAHTVGTDGGVSSTNVKAPYSTKHYSRPALILPSDTVYDDSMNIIV